MPRRDLAVVTSRIDERGILTVRFGTHCANNSSSSVSARLPFPRTCHGPADSTPKLLASPSRSGTLPSKCFFARLRSGPVIRSFAPRPTTAIGMEPTATDQPSR